MTNTLATTETPFFFPNASYSLFGILHEPATPSKQSGFVFCHPFAEEKLWAHRVFVTFARRLAAEGHTVLRFDYMGNGDSQGDFSQSSLTSMCSDVRSAIGLIRHRSGIQRVSLLGLRLGAAVASLVAEDDGDLDRLILWAPIVDGARYMQDMLRINLTTQMATNKVITRDREALVAEMHAGHTVNVDGYEMALPLFSEVSAVRLAASPKRHSRPCLITPVDRQAGPAPPDMQQLAASYGDSTLTAVIEDPFWKEIPRFYDEAPNLFTVTSEWLAQARAD